MYTADSKRSVQSDVTLSVEICSHFDKNLHGVFVQFIECDLKALKYDLNFKKNK